MQHRSPERKIQEARMLHTGLLYFFGFPPYSTGWAGGISSAGTATILPSRAMMTGLFLYCRWQSASRGLLHY